ncbi:MAG: hypothetical protein AUI14_00205 [Actinobacteria bacterium 13_2_20CM_2_71_6]|nr:MAG: hypothetical protein AUI14_00205 [Actinobacteria bacterium 13_2_20CM_2_71_6]
MRRRARAVRHVLTLSLEADQRAALTLMTLVVLQAGAVALRALAQRDLVDDAGLGVTVGLVAAALLGAVAHTISAAGLRIQNNLRIDLRDRVDVLLNQEILADAVRIPTVEHLERPDFLNRLTVLREGIFELATSCWSVAETGAAVVSLGLSVGLLASVHPALALLAVLSVPPLLCARWGQRRIRTVRDATAEQMRHERQLHDLCVLPEPAKEVRVAGNGPELSRRADLLFTATARQETIARMAAAGWELAGWACFAAGLLVALGVVGELVVRGAARVGDIVLVLSLATQVRSQISTTIAGISRVAEAGHVADHYLWLRGMAEGYRHHGTAPPPALTDGITLNGVSFRYPGTQTDVLREVTLHLRAGSTVGIIGVNGAGKTTLVKLLAGLHRPTYGSVTVDGRPLAELDPRAWAHRLSGAFQDFVKLETRTGETVGVGDLERVDDRPAVSAAVARAGAAGLVAALPQGLATQLGQTFGGAELSHGQWQKLALARGLMRTEPLLLVLDEPTAALDPQAEHDLFEQFAAQASAMAARRGAITVLVSHRFSTVHEADHIIVIDRGTVVEQGSHRDLMQRGGQYAELYRTQARGYA